MGLSCSLLGHKWNGCICQKCGEKRDENHDWNGCTCERCGTIRNTNHSWQGLKCVVCGQSRSIDTITDQSVLADLAKNAETGSDRVAALGQLTDQTALSYFAKNGNMRREAVERLTIQSVLTDVAKNDEDPIVRMVAAERLIDKSLQQTLYAYFAKNYENNYYTVKVIESLTSQEALFDIAKNGKNIHLRERSVENIHDRTLLIEIMNSTDNTYVDSYNWSVDNDTPEGMSGKTVIDLREVARKRLAELEQLG